MNKKEEMEQNKLKRQVEKDGQGKKDETRIGQLTNKE
jgi:hypothetical protein